MYQSDFELGYVALNVRDLDLQSLFYQQVLGLSVLKRETGLVDLGMGNRVLVRLQQTADQTDVKSAYGLYHLAIVLPSRKDLGQLFKHFLDHQVPLQGASDHGYSEALYLEDTEGNGIEIYRDLPMEDWDIREDGRVIGKTEPIDAEGLYALAKATSKPYQMPLGSRMGHVHLSVPSSRKAADFYMALLGLGDKFSVPTGSWLASGSYHHHLAVNQWAGSNLSKRQDKMAGLAYFTLYFHQADTYYRIIKKAQSLNLELDLQENQVLIRDENGIQFLLGLADNLSH